MAGYTASQTGVTCNNCPIGAYKSSISAPEPCLSCPIGMKTDYTVSTSLKDCIWENASVCPSDCAAGHYCVVPTHPGAVDVLSNGGASGSYGHIHYEHTDSVGSIYLVHNSTHTNGLSTFYTIKISGIQVVATTNLITDVLVVGGGGGGGGGQIWGCGGAGGGGGVTFSTSAPLTDGSVLTVEVGAGGEASPFNSDISENAVAIAGALGGSFKFASFTVVEGGGGGGSVASLDYNVVSQGLEGATSGGVGCAKSTAFTDSTGSGGGCIGSSGCLSGDLVNMAYCGAGGGANGTAVDPSTV